MIVDTQRGFVGPNTRNVPDQIESLLQERRGDFAIVIATQFTNHPGSNFRRLIDWTRLAESPEIDLLPAVAVASDLVIEKETYGAVPRLAEVLAERGIQTVYLCGIDTDVCVLQNAAGLFDLGLTPFVLIDACGTNGGAAAQMASVDLLGRTIGRRQVLRGPDSPVVRASG